jgi:hypothetical protein
VQKKSLNKLEEVVIILIIGIMEKTDKMVKDGER